MIESTTKDGVAVLTMRHGKANALDTELCQALCGALDDAVAGGAAAVVLTGAGPVFSAGVDLKRVTAGREGYVAAFLPELRRVFTRLAALELPVVAGVNGHAIAGGFILSAAADELVALIETTRRIVGFTDQETVPVSYSGGMFSDERFLALFLAVLQELPAKYDLRRPLLDPAVGLHTAEMMVAARSLYECAGFVHQHDFTHLDLRFSIYMRSM